MYIHAFIYYRHTLLSHFSVWVCVHTVWSGRRVRVYTFINRLSVHWLEVGVWHWQQIFHHINPTGNDARCHLSLHSWQRAWHDLKSETAMWHQITRLTPAQIPALDESLLKPRRHHCITECFVTVCIIITRRWVACCSEKLINDRVTIKRSRR